jgi:hypothetical protein
MSIGARLLRSAAVLASAAVLGGVSAAPLASSATPPSPLRAEVGFTCLWWSEAQMEGLDPNAPPPRNTEVKLTKWEYSDPVGVPHPDVIDVVITLATAGSAALSNLAVEVAGQWKTGPLRAAGRSAWGDRVVLKAFEGVTASASAPQTLRVPVDVKAMMDSLGRQRNWPYALRVSVAVRAPGYAQPLAQASAELPIRPGD